MPLVLTFFVGIIAGIMSGIVGAGAGLLTAPFFIFIGLPPQVAVATTKFGAVGLDLGALVRLRRSKEIVWQHVAPLLIISVVAAFAGSKLLLEIDEHLIERLVGFIILAHIPLILLKKDAGVEQKNVSRARKIVGFVLYFIILSLQAAFGAGLGTLLLFVMIFCFGFTFIESNATKRIPGFVTASIALLIYMFNNVVHYTFGIAMLLGMTFGGYLGTHLAIKKGNVWVKAILIAVLIAFGVKLLF